MPNELIVYVSSFLKVEKDEIQQRLGKHLRNHFENIYTLYAKSDIDIFVSGFEHSANGRTTSLDYKDTDSLCESVASKIHQEISGKKDKEYLYVKSPAAITFCGIENNRNIQIINCKDRTPEDALIDFDIDCVTFAYDGEQVYTLPRGRRAISTFCNFMDPYVLRFRRTRNRVIKYFYRGFSALLFENCKHFPRCDIELEPNLLGLWQQLKSSEK